MCPDFYSAGHQVSESLANAWAAWAWASFAIANLVQIRRLPMNMQIAIFTKMPKTLEVKCKELFVHARILTEKCKLTCFWENFGLGAVTGSTGSLWIVTSQCQVTLEKHISKANTASFWHWNLQDWKTSACTIRQKWFLGLFLSALDSVALASVFGLWSCLASKDDKV